MKESKLIEMRNRILNLEKVVTAILLRLEKIEDKKKLVNSVLLKKLVYLIYNN